MDSNDLERLLQSWINMELSIRGNRILSDFSFNEMIVCHMLLRCHENGIEPTATELCGRMHLLKSQMNRLLGTMEEKGLIERVRSEADHRKIYLDVCEKGRNLYSEEHLQILKILSAVYKEMGAAQFRNLSALMQNATDIVEKNLNKKE